MSKRRACSLGITRFEDHEERRGALVWGTRWRSEPTGMFVTTRPGVAGIPRTPSPLTATHATLGNSGRLRGMQQEGEKAGRFGDCSDRVIGACIEVHRCLGPGLLESAAGLLVNFHTETLRHGLRRLTLNQKPFSPSRLPVNSGSLR